MPATIYISYFVYPEKMGKKYASSLHVDNDAGRSGPQHKGQ